MVIVYLHELIVSDDLDCHLLASPGSVSSSDDVTEHTLSSVPIHFIPLFQYLTNVHTLKELFLMIPSCI